MLTALQFEWNLLRKRKILPIIFIFALIIVLIYQWFYYIFMTYSYEMLSWTYSLFFADGNKKLLAYYFLIYSPLIVCLFYTWRTIDDHKAMMLLETRQNKVYFVLARLLINFLVAFLFSLMVLGGIAICTWIITLHPSCDFYYSGMTSMKSSTLVLEGIDPTLEAPTFGFLFFSHPGVYYTIYILLWSTFNGLFATMGALAAYFTNKKIFVMLIPFAFEFLILIAFFQLALPLPYSLYNYTNVLMPFVQVFDLTIVPIAWIVYILFILMVIAVGVYLYLRRD